MKKIYSLIDRQNGEIVVSSKTRRALEEIMCDDFMDAFWWEMNAAVEAHWIDPSNPTENCRQFARDTWDMIMRFYRDVYTIQKSNLI